MECALEEMHLFGCRLTKLKPAGRSVSEDTIYLIAKSKDEIEQWATDLEKQCSMDITSCGQMSEFTRLQQERNQILKEEEERRIELLQQRFAKVWSTIIFMGTKK